MLETQQHTAAADNAWNHPAGYCNPHVVGSLRPTDHANTPAKIVSANHITETVGYGPMKRNKLEKRTILVRNQCPFMVQVILCPDANKMYDLAKGFNISLSGGPTEVGVAYGQHEQGVLARTGVPPGSRFLHPGEEGAFNLDGKCTYVTITDVDKRTLGVVNDCVREQQTLILSYRE